MFKVIRAAWRVMRGKDLNSQDEKPINVKKRTKQEIDAHLAQLAEAKAAATKREEPWVAIVTMDVDYNNLSNGSFELDWNDKFTTQLMRYGYQGKQDSDLVDQWFTDVCRNVVLETFEQGAADKHPSTPSDLGDGRREYK